MSEYYDRELQAFEKLLKTKEEESKKSNQRIVDDKSKREEDSETKVLKKLNKKAKQLEEDLEEELTELRLKDLIQTREQEFIFVKSRQKQIAQEHLDQQLKDAQKLYADINTIESKYQKKQNDKKKKELEQLNKINKLRLDKNDKEADKLAKKHNKESIWSDAFSKQFSDFLDQLKAGGSETVAKTNSQNLINTLKKIGQNITDGLNQINTSIAKYASYQTAINTRLQGKSSFKSVVSNLGDVAYSPLVKSEDLYANLNSFVAEGIVTNVEQRAFFETIKDSIATTFDANSESLRRMIRLQQYDSTAARLGMESYLTRFLNAFVENTEYLTTTFDTVASNLLEASALLASASNKEASTEFEYIVQKWLSALTGVGLSESTATAIANAINQLGSGDVSGLSNSALQNLLVMAASKQGLSYSNLLTSGLDATDANKLLYGITTYLQDLADYDNNVVKNQLAGVFGVTVTDLLAAKNFNGSDLTTLYNSGMTTSDMYSELYKQFSTITERQGIANILENLFSNYTFQTGMNIANNPATYALWKIADLIESTTGGINIPFVTALGNGVDINATVTQLMKLGIVGGTTLGAIGDIVNGLGTIGNGASLLTALQVGTSGKTIERGTGLTDYSSGNLAKRTSGTNISSSTFIGNTNSDAYYNDTLTQANDQAQTMLDQKSQDAEDATIAYFKDIGFNDKFNDIHDDIRALKTDGIYLKGNQNFSFEGINT